MDARYTEEERLMLLYDLYKAVGGKGGMNHLRNIGAQAAISVIQGRVYTLQSELKQAKLLYRRVRQENEELKQLSLFGRAGGGQVWN
jgi:hypothetical protein